MYRHRIGAQCLRVVGLQVGHSFILIRGIEASSVFPLLLSISMCDANAMSRSCLTKWSNSGGGGSSVPSQAHAEAPPLIDNKMSNCYGHPPAKESSKGLQRSEYKYSRWVFVYTVAD